MNILIDDLPTTLAIDDTEYPVDTDFRSCLQIMLAFEDNELTPQEKQIILLSNLYLTPPADTQYAISQGLWFLNGGEESSDTGKPRVYSFAKDADMIFAAFRQVHNIDLQTAKLHWWEFIALFMSVIADQDNPFGALVSLRSRLMSGKATKEERAAAREAGDLIDLPKVDDRTLEEKEMERRFNEAIEAAQRKRANGSV